MEIYSIFTVNPKLLKIKSIDKKVIKVKVPLSLKKFIKMILQIIMFS